MTNPSAPPCDDLIIKSYEEFREKLLNDISLLIDSKIKEIYNKENGVSKNIILLKSCKDGNLDKVIYAIESGADKNYCHDGIPVLIWSIKKMRMEVFAYLLKCGADPDITDRDGQTPLMISIQREYKKMSQMLIDHGASVLPVSNSGRTALHMAVIKNWEDGVLLLLENGASPNIKDKQMDTEAVLAAKLGYFGLVGKMIPYGVDETIEDSSSKNILRYVDNPLSWKLRNYPGHFFKK